MLTGRHIVRSINCINCGNYVGWGSTPFKLGQNPIESSLRVKIVFKYYEFANEQSQQGKEGKYVLELEKCRIKRGVSRYTTV